MYVQFWVENSVISRDLILVFSKLTNKVMISVKIVLVAVHFGAFVQDFPRLRGVALDTCRLALKYESTSHNHRSPGSMMLRRFLGKFNIPLTSRGQGGVHSLYKSSKTQMPTLT